MARRFLEKPRLAAAGGCGGGGNGQLPAGLDVGRGKTGGEGHAQACGPSSRTTAAAVGGAGWGLSSPKPSSKPFIYPLSSPTPPLGSTDDTEDTLRSSEDSS